MIKKATLKLIGREDLSELEMHAAMEEILSAKATPAQIGAFLTAMRVKGETVGEITAAAKAMRARTRRIDVRNHLINIDREEIDIDEETILDTSATGGDGTSTFTVSTATAFVAAGGGVRVAKHGSRWASSRCSSADVLQQLGVNLDVPPTAVESCIREIGIGFLYESLFNTALAPLADAGRELGFRTLFNLLGPLANPAGASAQVLGVYTPALTEKMARVLKNLGTREAFVVCGEATFDEISICGPTRVAHLTGGDVTSFQVAPEDFGLRRAAPQEIRGGDAAQNARIVRSVLGGETGPRRDIVLLNAAAAFVASGLEGDFGAGIGRAADSIDSGRAGNKLEALIRFSRSCVQSVRSLAG